ncbi:polysaccharide pyruvyl transferase family protein [Phocaeicola plebeius]|uniref:polysaccharide pyruvyl transferase family protein n=1 Tax=Phocaeicola plebeius TaxID=310297 RepID=UPI00402906FE
MEKKNILIINQPLNNRGDESAHKALVRTILNSMPNAFLTILFIGEDEDSVRQFKVRHDRVTYHNILAFKYTKSNFKRRIYQRLIIDIFYKKWLIECLYHKKTFLWNFNPIIYWVKHYIKAADYVVCAPGGICMGGFQYWPHIAYLYMAKLYNKKIYYYGRSFGPFPTTTKRNRRFKDISLELLKYFEFISIRDNKTEVLAKKLNINYIKTVDTAFLESPYENIPNEIQRLLQKRYMILVPNILIWHYAYKTIPKERITNLFLRIIQIIKENDSNIQIVMLPQTFNYHDNIKDDINFFKELKNKSEYNSHILVLNDIYSSDIQQSIISKADYLIGARYHSTVFAINHNIPFIALSYEHKITGLLESLGGENNMVDISDLSTEERVQDILKHIKLKLDTLGSSKELSTIAKKIANNCFDKFKNSING